MNLIGVAILTHIKIVNVVVPRRSATMTQTGPYKSLLQFVCESATCYVLKLGSAQDAVFRNAFFISTLPVSP